VTKEEFVELLQELMQQGERIEPNAVWRIRENGEREQVAEYDGNLSADYALYLYWAQHMTRCDYMNRQNRRHYDSVRRFSQTMRSAMVDDGADVIICIGTHHNQRSAVVGERQGVYDYEPRYPKAA